MRGRGRAPDLRQFTQFAGFRMPRSARIRTRSLFIGNVSSKVSRVLSQFPLFDTSNVGCFLPILRNGSRRQDHNK